MDFVEIFKNTKNQLTIIGTLPISEILFNSSKDIYNLLKKNKKLNITILYESDSDLFLQSLSTDRPECSERISFTKMREIRNRISRLKLSVKTYIQNQKELLILNRLIIKQINMRLLNNIIYSDDKLFYCPVLTEIPDSQDYIKIDSYERWYKTLKNYMIFYTNENTGGLYNSEPSDEMLVMYDKLNIPRGIFPRKAFYNTDFQRYSVWLFIFNRKGELLLHQRSQKTKDNRGLWDKSAGGHVDISDVSTFMTAERELIEELFLPKAEYTKYMKEDTYDIINLGVWRPEKRGYEKTLIEIKNFGTSDWAYYYISEPVIRTSKRRMHLNSDLNSKIEIKETKFISDIFLFVAPNKIIENKLKTNGLSKEVSINHKLITIPDLLQWIENCKLNKTENDIFTDDLLYIMDYLRGLLEEFSEMVKVTFLKGK